MSDGPAASGQREAVETVDVIRPGTSEGEASVLHMAAESLVMFSLGETSDNVADVNVGDSLPSSHLMRASFEEVNYSFGSMSNSRTSGNRDCVILLKFPLFAISTICVTTLTTFGNFTKIATFSTGTERK